MNTPQTDRDTLRRVAHYLRSVKAQSSNVRRWEAEEPAAAEVLADVESALASPSPETAVAAHRMALLGACEDLLANWEGNLTGSVQRIREAVEIASDPSAVPPAGLLAPSPDGSSLLEYLSNNFADDLAEVCGAVIAENLALKVSREFPDRWVTGWGTKTNRGIARTILHVMAQTVAQKLGDSYMPQPKS